MALMRASTARSASARPPSITCCSSPSASRYREWANRVKTPGSEPCCSHQAAYEPAPPPFSGWARNSEIAAPQNCQRPLPEVVSRWLVVSVPCVCAMAELLLKASNFATGCDRAIASTTRIPTAIAVAWPALRDGDGTRLLDAHRAAAEFYAEQLRTPEAAKAREFLEERGFDTTAWATFGCGYAPSGWDKLSKHLLGRGFELAELIKGGLSREGQRGPIDRFHRRLLWPIKDLGGDVVGFGARRLYDDDQIQAKYLNTSESPIYKKSQVLFGLDLAKREIARRHQVVVVEGYTDVMAMHLAGVTTAVASCGTAFGDEHLAMLRRLMMDDSFFRGELIYVFDGDEAGRRAAAAAPRPRSRARASAAYETASGRSPAPRRPARSPFALHAAR